MNIFVNRILNFKKIKVIGFDMDYTLVRYNFKEFEDLAHTIVLEKLVEQKSYPQEILKLKFLEHMAIRGLVIDKVNGNLIKVSGHGRIKQAYHGLSLLTHQKLKELYVNRFVDSNDTSTYYNIDTIFDLSYGALFGQLVDYKDKNGLAPSYQTIANDIKELIDLAHRDDSIKSEVKKDLNRFIIKDPLMVKTLERYLMYGKKLWLITNSDYAYSETILQYAINPYLENHRDWKDLFQVIITSSKKPSFFTDQSPFISIDPKTFKETEYDGSIENGIYRGGCASRLESSFKVNGDEILYLGDHIYGDILRLKKDCNWRTGLVVEELVQEIEGWKAAKQDQLEIDQLMSGKEELEDQLNELYATEFENKQPVEKSLVTKLFSRIEKLDKIISQKINLYNKNFNPYWGQIMKSGGEQSQFSFQIEKYACVYMSKVSDLYQISPRRYLRPKRKILPHEL